jgi:imidazole glycerol-phosphate synthase subunit HisH
MGMPPAGLVRVAVVDYGAGNLVSIRNALQLLGAQVRPARVAADLDGADVILVPGVGASEPAMQRLRRQGLAGPIAEQVRAGTWYVGICLGLQLLFERSHEDGARMLGLLPGDVVRLADAPSLPHIGWNRLEIQRQHPVMAGLADGTPAYFVHSYAPLPDAADVVIAETEHGGRFPSLVARDRIIGFQFHPERSGNDGLRLLANTLALVAGGASGEPAGAGTAHGAAAPGTAGVGTATARVSVGTAAVGETPGGTD